MPAGTPAICSNSLRDEKLGAGIIKNYRIVLILGKLADFQPNQRSGSW